MVQRGTRGRRAGSAQPAAPPPPTPAATEIEPKREEIPDPLDFETLPISALRSYRRHHSLSMPGVATFDGTMLGGGVGKRSWSYRNLNRVSRKEAAEVIKEHFMAENIRESETIVDFLYAVQNKDSVFKLHFA